MWHRHPIARKRAAVLNDARRMRADPGYRAKHYARKRIRNTLAAIGIKKSKRHSVSAVLGCSARQLKQHIERQFRPGMTWANHGIVWHIDHIIPLAALDLTKLAEFRRACHFSNLQPLFAQENRRKGCRMPERQMEFAVPPGGI